MAFGLLLCLLSLVVNASAAAPPIGTFESKKIEDLADDMSLIRLNKETFVALTVSNPDEDFGFMTEYAYEQLSRYNYGWNYGHVSMPQTTPMFIQLNIFDIQAERRAMFLVVSDFEGFPPAPRYPLYFHDTPETYYFVRKTTATEFKDLMEVASCMLTDLSFNSLPFEGTTVYLALYDYPFPEDPSKIPPNEIWVPRVLKHEEPDQCT